MGHGYAVAQPQNRESAHVPHRPRGPDSGHALRALDVARREVAFPADEVRATRLAILAMGKAGARELNYLSDVDVVYVADSSDEALVSSGRAVEIGTKLAMHTMRVLSDLVAGVSPEASAAALDELRAAGVTVEPSEPA